MDFVMHWALLLSRLAGPAAVIVAAQLFLKPKSENAAKWVTFSAALALVFPTWNVLWEFTRSISVLESINWLMRTVSPAFSAAAVAGISWGLVQLIDEANPVRATLSPALENARGQGANKFALIFWLVLGTFAVFATMGRSYEEGEALYGFGVPPDLVRILMVGGPFIALLVIQYASWRLQQHGGLARWVLTRRPQDVLWCYPHQLTVRRNGAVTGVHWSAMVSTATGYRVGLGAIGQEHAHALVLAISQHCPGVILGFSAEAAAAYVARRKALEAQAAQQTVQTTLR